MSKETANKVSPKPRKEHDLHSAREQEDHKWTMLCRIHTIDQVEDCELTDARIFLLRLDSKALARQRVKTAGQ